ncbi:MAG: hypothetical protein KJ957_06935, partial [Candidatus Omnitrophica bacterium]|nr:hypothetical protein [Candidatus Omnitrophota bacterium]
KIYDIILIMNSAFEIRHNHFRHFSELSPEEQLTWALSTGYSIWQLMPEDSRKYAERLRNGWKKYLSRSKCPVKNS